MDKIKNQLEKELNIDSRTGLKKLKKKKKND